MLSQIVRSWNRLPLISQMLMAALIALLTASFTLLVVMTQEETKQTQARLDESMSNQLAVIPSTLSDWIAVGDFAVLKEAFDHLVVLKNVDSIRFVTPRGAEVSSQDQPAKLSAPEWFVRQFGDVAPHAKKEIVIGGRNYGTLDVGFTIIPSVNQAWTRLERHVSILLFAILMNFTGMWLVLRASLRPLNVLNHSARALARGDFSVRVPVVGSPEIRNVIDAFNYMAERVQTAVDDLRGTQRFLEIEHQKLHITLMSIGDGVIKTDPNGLITLMNPAAETLTGWTSQEAEGMPIEQVFNIVNESERIPIESPVRHVLAGRMAVGLANHTILLSRSGGEFVIEDSAAPIFIEDGTLIGSVLVFHNATDKYRLIDRVSWQATHDHLTSLPNRVLLEDRLQQAIAHADRNHQLLAICLLDLDGFKPINDSLGHAAGDVLLLQVAQRITALLRGTDTLARLGGDEFVLLFGGLKTVDDGRIIIESTLSTIAEPYVIEGEIVNISASVGVTLYPHDGATADILLRHADIAMYEAKRRGRNQHVMFNEEQELAIQSRQRQMDSIQQGLDRNEFLLHFQPKVDMRHGKVLGYEALARWQHPERGLLGPSEFLPLIEGTALVDAFDQWVLEAALIDLSRWLAAGYDWSVSVNIAPKNFTHATFPNKLKAILERHPNIPPGLLELEILESSAISDMSLAIQNIDACHRLGVRVALDDFGVGYASLSYLRRLQVDTVKIDQSFVRDILDASDDLILVEAIISMAQLFNRTIVAEGIEQNEQGMLLLRLGCDVAQGYGIARPMPAGDVIAWASQWQPDPRWALWADTYWEMHDFPLLVAQYDHLRWVKKVLNTLESGFQRINSVELSDHHKCRFGHWYYGHGQCRYGHLKEFIDLEPAHIEVHQVGIRIVQYCQIREIEKARSEVPRLLQLKEDIFEHLNRLQKRIANIRAQDDP
jgi:diguanylate cyclase